VKDERNQVLIAYLWIRQTWHDAYLRWNKEDYDGLEIIHIPSSLVWRPDLVLYNKYARTSPQTYSFSDLSVPVENNGFGQTLLLACVDETLSKYTMKLQTDAALHTYIMKNAKN